MEKQVNELINRIMNSKNIDSRDLNEMVKLHKIISDEEYKYLNERRKLIKKNQKDDFIFSDDEVSNVEIPDESYVFERQLKRLEMALKDKLKQINLVLSEGYLNELENILFKRGSKADIKDIRLINKHDIAIIRENSIELGDSSFNADKLNAGMDLCEEAFLCNENTEEDDYADPKIIFSDFYNDMDNKIQKLKEDLKILDRDAEIYFDRCLDSFYFDGIDSFTAIVTELPNTIEIYDVKISEDKWIPKKINGDEVRDFMDRLDFSLLSEYILTTTLKNGYQGKTLGTKTDELDIEMVLDKFKQEPFSSENLINTYNNLFNCNNCMLEENKNEIIRLKYLTAEKLVKHGFDYSKALYCAETIFEIIDNYKKQILDAINGDNKFPKESLVDAVKKLKI